MQQSANFIESPTSFAIANIEKHLRLPSYSGPLQQITMPFLISSNLALSPV